MNTRFLMTAKSFIFLLIALFFANSVCANQMMLMQAASNLSASSSIHCHENIAHAHHAADHTHQKLAHQTPVKHSACTSCGHCLACFSAIQNTAIVFLNIQQSTTPEVAYELSYLSHISDLPKKPPIST